MRRGRRGCAAACSASDAAVRVGDGRQHGELVQNASGLRRLLVAPERSVPKCVSVRRFWADFGDSGQTQTHFGTPTRRASGSARDSDAFWNTGNRGALSPWGLLPPGAAGAAIHRGHWTTPARTEGELTIQGRMVSVEFRMA
ncbi:hypothetical protein HMPREF9005_2448 [Actinomyces sp. oral taxon 178 str. F0338]|nr:hypothetical protein HMPREF9005_2448 [Actinomyces sp. oral taxon 178 str. F0338]